jgi:tetratricopeptide (TPR) repeat protein
VAEVLIEMNERLDEAEDHLLQARAMSTDPADEAHVEFHLGDIAMEREQYEEALVHYQHFADHNPNSPIAWFNIAEAQSLLENFEEADVSYRRSISLQSENDEIYLSLSQMYATNNQLSKAIEVLEEGLDANPESILLVVSLATLHLENNDLRQVEILVERAERIDPDSGAVQMIRQMLNLIKREQDPSINRSNRPGLKRPRRKRH